MFAYGFLSVVLVLYLAQLGLSQGLIGLLLSLTLFGDAVISLWMTTAADRVGRADNAEQANLSGFRIKAGHQSSRAESALGSLTL